MKKINACGYVTRLDLQCTANIALHSWFSELERLVAWCLCIFGYDGKAVVVFRYSSVHRNSFSESNTSSASTATPGGAGATTDTTDATTDNATDATNSDAGDPDAA